LSSEIITAAATIASILIGTYYKMWRDSKKIDKHFEQIKENQDNINKCYNQVLGYVELLNHWGAKLETIEGEVKEIKIKCKLIDKNVREL